MSLALPWADPEDRAYSLPTSLLVKMRLGEAPDHVPAHLDVLDGCGAPAARFDGGPIDRLLTRHAGAVRATRLHASARHLGHRRQRHLAYDDLEHLTGIARTYVLQVPAGTPIARLCDALRQTAVVETAGPNYLATAPMEAEPGLERVRATNDAAAWRARDQVRLRAALALEPGDPGLLIGLIDSGIGLGHPELAGRFAGGGYDTVRLTPGDVAAGVRLLGDFERDDPHPVDDFVGHGMGCAGILLAHGRQMPPGLAGACRLLPMRALGAAKLPDKVLPVGLGALSDLDLAMSMAVNAGARVLNLSFGTSEAALAPGAPRPHADILCYAAARGCVLVAASGNSGRRERFWPAAAPEVIAVGAVDDRDRLAGFSTRGEHVALSAPGARILTTSLGGYQYATGTSFAAPFVSATAALLLSRAARRGVALRPADLRALLTGSVRPFAGSGSKPGGGAGILDAAAALRAFDDLSARPPPSPGGHHGP